ncbi:hypothetical protein L6452_19485 [Arctium lappa]|uniref:Uncharacterized protein n=1 Tax=Arctium lappa TaxID=4217 RepID=A0ACB9B9Z9_ARCLA|nr:hypothetical protein L6452_19485 [Arctium lappa]
MNLHLLLLSTPAVENKTRKMKCRNDYVEFCRSSIRSSSTTRSTKKRKLDDSNKDQEDSLVKDANSRVVLEEVLEEAPKWKVLCVSENDECVVESAQDDNGIVLVACKDEHCVQLEECITSSPNKIAESERVRQLNVNTRHEYNALQAYLARNALQLNIMEPMEDAPSAYSIP